MEDRYLFKAKRLDWRKFPEKEWWITGYYVLGFDDEYKQPVHLIFEPITMYSFHADTETWTEIEKNTLCQCTGLKDKNGKLIWENDIVCHEYKEYTTELSSYYCKRKRKNYVIKWDNTMVYCGFRYHNSRNIFPLKNGTISNGNDVVIGNIFDNPELLESEG